MRKSIGFFIFPGYQMLDLSGPLCVFQIANRIAGDNPYRLQILSSGGGRVLNSLCLSLETKAAGRRELDTLIVVGGEITKALEVREVTAVRTQAKHARRIASVCTGAFVLAQANLLNGKRATTHWRFAPRLQRDYPSTRVDSDAIFIQDGNTWTSAGIAAGIDLALALIQHDLGLELSRAVAREMVVYHRRPGGQSQFSALSQLASESDRMQLTLTFIRDHLSEELPMERLAEAARLSLRQFGRVFKKETGETPGKAVERVRAEVARSRIETTTESIEVIAATVGFHDPERMRRAFLRIYGHPPQAIRRNARLL
jgi:transcriptional regulator GlxA family with amidase domain